MSGKIVITGLDQFEKRLRDHVENVLEARARIAGHGAQAIEANIADNVQRASDFAAENTAIELVENTDDRTVAAVGFDKKVFIEEILEKGARPHEIRPKDKKALTWAGANNPTHMAVIKHPGVKPGRHVKRAIDESGADVRKALKEGYERELR